MRIYNYQKLSDDEVSKLCQRNLLKSKKIQKIVSEIKEKVKKDRDRGLKTLHEKFSGTPLKDLKVTEEEINEAEDKISSKFKHAIYQAYKNITKFHRTQLLQRFTNPVETTPGIFSWREFRAIERVGLYVPGGKNPLFSSLLMQGIPAQIAKCAKIVIATPANQDNSIAPEMLVTAKILNIKDIYKIGGAQAIFALYYGTETVPKVDKIFGPGNIYVTAAKMNLAAKIAIDMPAGPSEVLIIANRNSASEIIAADLLAQLEHGESSKAILVSDSKTQIDEVISQIDRQLDEISDSSIMKKTISASFALYVPNLDKAIEFSNLYAPEHLILAIDDFAKYLPKIHNVGSVFCGRFASVSFGDYASGVNHILPTSGFAKTYSSLSVEDFGKWITLQRVSPQGFAKLSETVEVLADSEGLFFHKEAVKIRRKYEEDSIS